MKKIILTGIGAVLIIAIALGCFYKDYIFNYAEISEFKNILEKSATLADQTYIDAMKHYKAV